MDVIAAPDVFVNASVALGSAPDHASRRILGAEEPAKTSKWVIERVTAMLQSIPDFKPASVDSHMATIRRLTTVVEEGDYSSEDWKAALVAVAKAAKIPRILTDHPDLVALGSLDGVEFVQTEAWLIERSIPPPAPDK